MTGLASFVQLVAVTLLMPSAVQQPGLSRVMISSVFADSVPAVEDDQLLIVRHLYVACVDAEAKQPAWVAFRVRRTDWDTENVLERNFTTPEPLRDQLLESTDYDGSGYDLGHLYGLQFVSANQYAHEVNQLCAVAAQRPALNRGPWLKAENRVRKLSETGEVSVLCGQLWLNPMPKLIHADEPHKVASHCWMIMTSDGNTEAYLFAQSAVQLSDPLRKFSVPVDELRARVSSSWWGSR